jgi:hypothetical protein
MLAAWRFSQKGIKINKFNSFEGILMNFNSWCPRKYAPPPSEICPPPSEICPPPLLEIWPPRKHSLLYRNKLGNREASSKTKILKVFVSIYS